MADAGSLRTTLLFGYGRVLTRLKRRRRALEIFRSVTHAAPRHAGAWRCAGFLRAAEARYDEALADFERAAALEPRDAPTCFNVAFMLQRLGRHDAALARLAEALALDPAMDRGWFALGLSRLALGRHAEAAEAFGKAAALKPGDPYAGYHLAGIWHTLGEAGKLQAEYLRVKALDPKVADRIRTECGLA